MYFSNIANDELQHFHNTSGADFTMSLTDILTSNLFEVETIITDNLYRVYPLFYCKEIVTNNPNDKNLDNRVLILQKREHETYVSFMTEEQNNILLDETVLDIKQIGDKLSDADFNRMVYMFRKKGVITGNIDFENNTTITGQYATYNFENVAGQLRNDSGLIVNNKIKNNPITVKLQNPFFLSAKYTILCTVRSLTGANIYDDDTNYKVKDTFAVELVNGSSVAIDVSNYTNDSVLDFVMEVDISFDVPEIMNNNFLLSLAPNDNFIVIGHDLVLTANLTGEGNVEGYTVKFYEDNAYIGLASTDENGVAVFEYTPSVISNHVYSARVFGLESNVNVEVGKYTTSINLTSNKNVAYIPTTFTLNGVCTRGNGVLSNASILILNNNSTFDTLTTDNNGTFTKTVTANENKTYNFQAVYDGSSEDLPCNSNIKNIVARKLNTNLTINLNKSSMYYTETVTISGKLTDELGRNMTGVTIRLYQDNSQVATATTNNSGNYSFSRTNSAGYYTFKVSYDGDGTHNNKTSSNKSLTVNEAPTTTTILNPKSTYQVGEELLVKVSSDYGDFNPSYVFVRYANQYMSYTEKDGNGNFKFVIPHGYTANTELTATFWGETNYASSNSDTIIVSVDDKLNALSLTLQGDRTFIINVKKNGNNVVNTAISGLYINIMGYPTTSINLGTQTTNSSGNITYTLKGYDSYAGTTYVSYGYVSSNSVSIPLILHN